MHKLFLVKEQIETIKYIFMGNNFEKAIEINKYKISCDYCRRSAQQKRLWTRSAI